MKRNDLTEGSISKHILKLSGPLILSYIFASFFEFIDFAFIGKLSKEAMSGVGMSGRIIFFLFPLAIGLSVGTATLVAHYTGKKDQETANRTAEQSFLIGIFFSIFLSVIGYFFSSKFLFILGARNQVLQLGTIYLKTIFVGIATIFFLFLGSAVLRGAGYTKTPMKITIFSFILNIFLDWVLIFGKFGLPAMGVKGSALATIISRGIGCIIIITLLIKGKHNIHIKLKNLIPDFKLIIKLLKIGIPTSGQMLIRSITGLVMAKFVSYFGTASIASHEMGFRVFHFFLLPGFAFADSAQTMVAQNLAAGKKERARKSSLISVCYYLILLSVFCSVTFIFSEFIVKMINTDKDVVRIGSDFLRFISVGAVFLSLGLVFNRTYQGAGDAVTPLVVVIVSLFVVQLPIAYYLSFHTGLKETGIWLSYPLASFLQAFFMTILFIRGKWMHRKI